MKRWWLRFVVQLLQHLCRCLLNRLGCAWWARVHCTAEDVTYWLGPFVRRRSLRRALVLFMADLRMEAMEGQQHLKAQELRTGRREPLTYRGRP